MIRRCSKLGWTALVIIVPVLVAGCGDSQEAKNSKTAPTTSTSTAAPVASPPRYQATLEEGIDFSKDGFPTFIADVEGLSGRESFGRWSDANLAPVVRFNFRDPLPRKFEVTLTASAIQQNEKLPVVVRAGGVEQSFSFEKPGATQTQVLVFDLPRDANSLEVVAPKPISPKVLDPNSKDERRLGIAFVSLKIRKL